MYFVKSLLNVDFKTCLCLTFIQILSLIPSVYMLVLTYLDIYITGLLNLIVKTYNEFEFLISVHLLPGFRGACPPHIPGRSAGGQLYPTHRPGIYGRSTPRSLLNYNWTLSSLKARTMVLNTLSCSTNLPPGFRSLELLSFLFSKIADVFFLTEQSKKNVHVVSLPQLGADFYSHDVEAFLVEHAILPNKEDVPKIIRGPVQHDPKDTSDSD